MDLIGDVITWIMMFLSKLTLVYLVYQLVVSLFGIYRKKNEKKYSPSKSFALVVAAHNEDAVVADVIKSLQQLDYPKELFDIHVIADNCTDKTAEISRNAGADYVHERCVEDKRGKGYALEWVFDKIFTMDKEYDSIAIFDADNLVSKGFLTAMNNKLMDGYKVVQGYLDSKNPQDSWITGCYSLTFWQTNRTIQLAKQNIGLSGQLGGTGFCIDTTTLKELGWGATCLTEDLEFTCKLVTNGERVGWAHDAIIYDEKPLTLKQSWHQRKRWMQGFADVASRYFFKLLKKGIKDRSWTAIDCAIYSIQPYFTVLMGVTLLYSAVQFTMVLISGEILNAIKYLDLSTMVLSIGMLFLYYIYYLFIMSLDKKLSLKLVFYYLVLYYFYMLTWIPISVIGILDKNKKEWSHTKHTRSLDISEIEL